MAESLFRELIASSESPVLLHGDLHHFNILSARRQPWLAIDPKGVAGEPAYEPGALLRNPNPELCTDIEVQRRA
jgi:streptomycin 6-kinase